MDCVFEGVDNKVDLVLDLSFGASRQPKQKRKSSTPAALGLVSPRAYDELSHPSTDLPEESLDPGSRSSSPADFSKRLKLNNWNNENVNSGENTSENLSSSRYDHEYVLHTLERLSSEVLYVKKALVDLPEKVVADLSGYIKAEVSSQFQTLYRRLSNEIRATVLNANSSSFLPVANSSNANNESVQHKSPAAVSQAKGSSPVINLSSKTTPYHRESQNSAFSIVTAANSINSVGQGYLNSPSTLQTSKECMNSISLSTMKIVPEKVDVNSTGGASLVQLPGFANNLVTALPSSNAVGTTAVHQNIASGHNVNVPTNSLLASVHQADQHGTLSSNGNSIGGSCNGTMVPVNVVTPKYIQAPVQIRIEDLKQECNVHKVKILDITPTVDIFELADEFIYRIFLKYKYPSIFVQALFVLHYGSFRAMHLNTSSRVKNNLELIPETFITRLTLLVVRWFPSVEDLDFGKCLNQKQRSILSAARSCLFFKKCDACKKRNIDSLPSTYSVKNLTLIAAQQQQQSAKREDLNNRLGVIKPQVMAAPTLDISTASLGFNTTGAAGSNQTSFIKTENVYPTPPLSDSLSPPSVTSDLSESLTSVFDRVAELVNGSGTSNEHAVYTVTDLKNTA